MFASLKDTTHILAQHADADQLHTPRNTITAMMDAQPRSMLPGFSTASTTTYNTHSTATSTPPAPAPQSSAGAIPKTK